MNLPKCRNIFPLFFPKFQDFMRRIRNWGVHGQEKRYLIFNVTTEFNIEAKKNSVCNFKQLCILCFEISKLNEKKIGMNRALRLKSLQKSDCGGIHLPSEL